MPTAATAAPSTLAEPNSSPAGSRAERGAPTTREPGGRALPPLTWADENDGLIDFVLLLDGDGLPDTDDASPAFRGEVWTDARGYATVALPRAAGRLHGELEYELRPLTRGAVASIAAELIDGRFTIATDEPHVKVAWRVGHRRTRWDD